jgi:hypothetical protein
LLDEPELGKELRLSENEFSENLVVKQIQAPRPEPNQVDQKDRDYDDNEKNDRKEPLQDAFKHKDSLVGWGEEAAWIQDDFVVRGNAAITSSPPANAIDALNQAANFGCDIVRQRTPLIV